MIAAFVAVRRHEDTKRIKCLIPRSLGRLLRTGDNSSSRGHTVFDLSPWYEKAFISGTVIAPVGSLQPQV